MAHREEIGVLVRLDAVGLIALASMTIRSSVLSVLLVLALTVWPITVVIPMRWRGELSQHAALGYSCAFLFGFVGIFIAAYGDTRSGSFPSAALVVAFMAIHMAAVGIYVGARGNDFRVRSVWIAATVLFLVGAIADLPNAIWWNAAALGIYGLASGVVMHRIQRSGQQAAEPA